VDKYSDSCPGNFVLNVSGDSNETRETKVAVRPAGLVKWNPLLLYAGTQRASAIWTESPMDFDIVSQSCATLVHVPRELLQNELQSEVSSGRDQHRRPGCLSTALDDIDATLRSQRPEPGSARPSRSEVKSKIDD